MKTCDKCGAPNRDDAVTCTNCGEAIKSNKPKKSKKPLIITLSVIGTVILFGAGVLLGLYATGALSNGVINDTQTDKNQEITDNTDSADSSMLSSEITIDELTEQWGEPDSTANEDGLISMYYNNFDKSVYGVKIDTVMVSFTEEGIYNGALYITPDYDEDAAFERDLNLVLNELKARAGEGSGVSVYKYDEQFDNEEELEVSGFDDLPINTMLNVEGCYTVVSDTQAITVYNIPDARSLAINEFGAFGE